jgi:SAM-dependent methyltransferase
MSKVYYHRPSEIAINVNFDVQRLKAGDFDDLTVLFRLYYSLEFAIGQVFSDDDGRHFPNASYSVLRFIDKLRSIQRIVGPGLRFLDVGCGLGNKVWIAQELGFDAYGIEINQKYVEIASEYIGADRIFCHDGVTFEDYAQYDVIYFYNPMPSVELENAILAKGKKGAIIYHAIGLRSQPSRAFERLSAHVMRLTDEAPKFCLT